MFMDLSFESVRDQVLMSRGAGTRSTSPSPAAGSLVNWLSRKLRSSNDGSTSTSTFQPWSLLGTGGSGSRRSLHQAAQHPASGTYLQPAWDWRALRKVTPIKNGGVSCSSCWAL